MMNAISRDSIFKRSAFIDNQISRAQMTILRTVNQEDEEEVIYTTSLLDHLQAFDPKPDNLNGFRVIAYPAIDKSDYENNFSTALGRLLNDLSIPNMYLLTDINYDWKDFIFENEDKKSLFLSYTKGITNTVGYLFESKDIELLLPLFYQHHPDCPSIGLMNSTGDIQLDMFMCKDGNLHVLYDEKHESALLGAVKNAGLISGSFDVCQNNREGRL